MTDHSEMVVAQKAALEKENKAALKKDIDIHCARSKKASETKEAKIADKQEVLACSRQYDEKCHKSSKEGCENTKEECAKLDCLYHEEHQERAAYVMEEVAEKQQEDFDRFECDLEEHLKKASARHETAAAIALGWKEEQ